MTSSSTRRISHETSVAHNKRTGRKKHSSSNKRPSGYIKRPLNAFFLFRQKFTEAYRKEHPRATQAVISKEAGASWRNLPLAESSYWYERQYEVLVAHKVAHPQYMYQPQRKRRSRNRYYEAAGITAWHNKSPRHDHTLSNYTPTSLSLTGASPSPSPSLVPSPSALTGSFADYDWNTSHSPVDYANLRPSWSPMDTSTSVFQNGTLLPERSFECEYLTSSSSCSNAVVRSFDLGDNPWSMHVNSEPHPASSDTDLSAWRRDLIEAQSSTVNDDFEEHWIESVDATELGSLPNLGV